MVIYKVQKFFYEWKIKEKANFTNSTDNFLCGKLKDNSNYKKNI